MSSSATPEGSAANDTPAHSLAVFLSYRRSDDSHFVGRFYDKLAHSFGHENVFRDIDSIPAGADFTRVIEDSLSQVDAVVVLIGPTWTSRLSSPGDFVRMEVAQALASGKPVVPVLVEETPLPPEDALPSDVHPLLDRNAGRVRRDPDFHRDAERVIEDLRHAVRLNASIVAAAAEAARRSEQLRAIEEAKRISAELAIAEQLEKDRRKAAAAIERERNARQADLARLEEELTRRQIADKRLELAELDTTTMQLEEDARAAESEANRLRALLDSGSHRHRQVDKRIEIDVEAPIVARSEEEAGGTVEAGGPLPGNPKVLAATESPIKSRPSRSMLTLVASSIVAAIAVIGLIARSSDGGDGEEKQATGDSTLVATEPTAATESTAAPESTAATGEETTTAAGGSGSTDTAGALAGMKGPTPLVKLSDDFATQLQGTPTAQATPFTDPHYAGETYDAITIVALAVEIAQSDGIEYASEIQGVTRQGEKCVDFASCKALVDAGTDIDYDGKSGDLELNGVGDPLQASYGVLQFGDDNRIDDSLTTFVAVEAGVGADVPTVPVTGSRAGDGVLRLGSILPQTGSLAFLGPPMFAGAELAVADINDAGGVLGVPVEYEPGDSGDIFTNIASVTTDRLLGENVDAIVGAASSSVSLTVIDRITDAGVVQFSPANASNAFTDYPDKGLYFRVSPPDVMQGNLTGQLVADDGNSTAYILALDNAYGTSLAEVIDATLAQSGVEIVGTKIYDPEATSFAAEVDEIKSLDPDAIVLVTFDEGSIILRTMVEAGIGPQTKNVYGVDGNMGNLLGINFDAGE